MRFRTIAVLTGVTALVGVTATAMAMSHATPETTYARRRQEKARKSSTAPQAPAPSSPKAAPSSSSSKPKTHAASRTATLTHGVRYIAKLRLISPQSLASNDQIANALQEKVGPLTELHVLGQGPDRTAQGTYAGKTKTISLPDAVLSLAPVDAVPAHVVKVAPSPKPKTKVTIGPVREAPPAPPGTREMPPAPPGTPQALPSSTEDSAPVPASRTPKQAAEALYQRAALYAREGRTAELGTKAHRSTETERDQMDMKGPKLQAALDRGEGGIYGPLTRARGKELLGRDFPQMAPEHKSVHG